VAVRLALALLLALAAASGAAQAEWSANLEYRHFKWTEPSIGVTETGPLFGIGLDWNQNPARGWALGYRGRYYFGTVDYDGATLVGNQPVTGSVDYNGLFNEVQARHLLGSDVRGVLGLGLDYWNRQLTQVQHEQWYVYFLRAGVEWGNTASPGWFVGGGIKYPFYVIEDPNARSIGFDQDVRLHPQGAPSFYADLGYRVNRRYAFSAFYDSYRFDQSDSVNVTGQTCLAAFGVPNCRLLQPASNADMFGVRLHLYF